MSTIGVIGAGHIGSQFARLAVAHGDNAIRRAMDRGAHRRNCGAIWPLRNAIARWLNDR
jgi:phosphoglycerate dehydrogenase-like enzyme